MVIENGCLQLLCSSSPRGPVEWYRADGKPLRPVQESCSLEASSCAPGVRGNGVLVVEEVGSEDAGYYICSATLQNQTSSEVCHVLIGGQT